MARSSELNFAGFTWPVSKGCRACKHVMEGAPVLLFVHEEDGSLQFLCGALGHTDGDALWVHASHVLDLNPDLEALPKVEFGQEAERDAVGEDWQVSVAPPET